MAYSINNQTITLDAAVDLSAAQYHLIVCDANGKADLAGDGDANIIGVLQNNPAADQAAAVMVSGVSKVVASAAIAPGDQIASAAGGAAETAATVGDGIIGVSLTAAAAAGEIISMLIARNGLVA